ncbi:YhcH/YjgK/YiaL family protein [Romboutsia sp. 13368]|uniref:YhcH/YjgK/YiaL family protein n=1 Tax=Romboutsia sp. 13368 TaxID=2708053 RepID=UPI0025D80968|nr:YhcH/YjgK/YiaL family protein [Romboutsia sp. 13368]
MILDSIKNISKYENLNIDLKSIVEFIDRVESENLENGKYELDGDKLFALVQSYETKDSDECRLESHKKYIDIQYVQEGTEVMYWSLVDGLKVTEDLSEVSDVIFYEDDKNSTELVVNEKSFALFFTHDAHKPGVKFNTKSNVRKIVFKILQG